MELRTSFYEQLLQLPLFQGTNRSDFMEIVEKVKFSFFKARETQLVARQDALSNRLVFILGAVYALNTQAMTILIPSPNDSSTKQSYSPNLFSGCPTITAEIIGRRRKLNISPSTKTPFATFCSSTPLSESTFSTFSPPKCNKKRAYSGARRLKRPTNALPSSSLNIAPILQEKKH